MLKLLALALLLGGQDRPLVPPLGQDPLVPPLGGGSDGNAEVAVKAVRPEKTDVKAGEILDVALDLEIPKGWYIYPTTPTTTGIPTSVTLEGAEVYGRIGQPKPKVKPKSDFADAYAYHEGAVTLTVPVRLPKDAAPGSLSLEGRLDYQICKDVCLLGKTAFTVDLKVGKGPAYDDDNPPPLGLFRVTPDKKEVRVGETFTVEFEVDIPPEWHIYPTYKFGNSLPTEFKIEGAEVAGKIAEPEAKLHPKDENVEAYKYHEGRVVFGVPLRLKPGAEPGPLEVKGRIEYLICNPRTCIPGDLPVSFRVKVLEGTAGTGEAVEDPGAAPAPPPVAAGSLPYFLFIAFLGGLILNVMPCVLPVLTLKLFSLVKQKNVTAGARYAAAFAYTAGALACLNAFALAVVIIRGFGGGASWGFQMQEPLFVIPMTTVVFVFALSMLGVFEVPAIGEGAAAKASGRGGWIGHFFGGLFATLVATPCSAPFLGPALGFAFTLPDWGVFLFFSVAALGLALPFLLVGFIPGMIRFLPKPGPWLDPFKKIMGFGLVVLAVWLITIIGSLTGREGLNGYLYFLSFVSVGAWIYGKWGSDTAPLGSRLASFGAAVLLGVFAGWMFLETEIAEPEPASTAIVTDPGKLDYGTKIPWQPFSDRNVEAVRAAGRPGFIDFTADW